MVHYYDNNILCHTRHVLLTMDESQNYYCCANIVLNVNCKFSEYIFIRSECVLFQWFNCVNKLDVA